MAALPVLVLTQRFDPTADYVVMELTRRGVPVVRIDPGDFPAALTFAARLGEGWSGVLRSGARLVDLVAGIKQQINRTWHRRRSEAR